MNELVYSFIQHNFEKLKVKNVNAETNKIYQNEVFTERNETKDELIFAQKQYIASYQHNV